MTATVLESIGRVVPEAVHLGPTWEKNVHWDGVDWFQEFVLPEHTLGWQQMDWVEENLLGDDGKPFKLTWEQTRFLLWWYAVDKRGVFVYREGVLQRLKGWGKDPLAAVICAIELVGPCRFSHWAVEAIPERGIDVGDPVATEHRQAWVQVAAVSKDQTRNTMLIFMSLFTEECKVKHRIDVGKEQVYAHGGTRLIQAVTSSPKSLEGGRVTFVLKNETHHWLLGNNGHEMAEVIERNATKSKGGTARSLSITNAYEPSNDSVAQHEREAWENEQDGLSIDTGVLYDSLEASPDAVLIWDKNEDGSTPTDEQIKAYIGAVIEGVRGDATWLNVERIVASILDKKNKPSTSRRFYYNQVGALEDAWAIPAAVEAATDPYVKSLRASTLEGDTLRIGWIPFPKEEVVMFFDGSKSDDATGLILCRVSDGYVFTGGVWQKPSGDRGKGWIVPRFEVDKRVDELFARFNIVAFFADPSHAKDDDDDSRFWDGLIDGWHRKYKDRLGLFARKGGDQEHSIMWDMTSPERLKLFVAGAETFREELHTQNADEHYVCPFAHDGHPALRQHLKNARAYASNFGTSLTKDNRESAKKIDLAVCAVGARMLRRMVVNKGLEDKKPVGSKVWGNW